MSGNLQPKSLYELAFGSFITCMENEARQLMKLDPTPEAVTVTSRVCGELKIFFHGTRLPSSMANQLTKHLLIKLDDVDPFSLSPDCCEEMLLSLVEVFMHPDVTAIELGQSYFHGFDPTPCHFITWLILQKVRNLHNLKALNLPAYNLYRIRKPTIVFPSQLKELTVCENPYRSDEILRSIVKFCPGLKSLTMCRDESFCVDVKLLLQCKHLETLRLSRLVCAGVDTGLPVMKSLSTDTTSEVLNASTLKSFSLGIRNQKTLRLIVDKLSHLTEIELFCKRHIDLSSLTQLKNLRSLTLEALNHQNANEYKKILPVLGKNLVFLELRGKCALDLEFIGETCTHLKCLHFCDISHTKNLNPSLNTVPSFKTIPNFKTIECLKIQSYLSGDFVPFLISQCINIKTLIVDINNDTLNTTIEDVLRRTPPLNWVVIAYWLEDEFDSHFIDSLPSRHPNFRVVKSHDWMRFSSQTEVFDSLGCYF